jgi:hypothetical protein
MKKLKALLRPARQADFRFNELYEDISNDWRDKAERLQARRWNKLKQRLV